MSDFFRTIDKASAELSVAKTLGPQHAEAALVQARCHINLALDDVRRQGAETKQTPNERLPPAHERPLYLHLTNQGGNDDIAA